MTVMHVDVQQRPTLVQDKQMPKTDDSSHNDEFLWGRTKQNIRPVDTKSDTRIQKSQTNKKTKVEKSQSRGKRKSRWKLKFHHQALPPEYLKHYKQQEKKRLRENKKIIVKSSNNNNKVVKKPVKNKKEGNEKRELTEEEKTFPSLNQRLNVEQVELESTMNNNNESPFIENNALQNEIRILDKRLRENAKPENNEHRVRCKSNKELFEPKSDSKNHVSLANLLSKQDVNRVEKKRSEKVQPIPSSGRIRNYSDLPYMGEITLDGIKPRRGRKPKKADICHLIYKNYGQVFPGGPHRDSILNSSREGTKAAEYERPTESPLPTVSGMLNHTQVQHRIINSLLEKRLTSKQEKDDQPLNLCIKDLNSLKIKLSRKHGNIYETNQIKSECVEQEETKKSDSDPELVSSEDEEEDEDEDERLAPFNLVSAELGESSDEEIGYLNENVTLTRINKPTKSNNTMDGSSSCDSLSAPPLTQPPPHLMYWPGNNLIFNPMLHSQLLYYQKLSQEMNTQPVPPSNNNHKSDKKKKSDKPVQKRSSTNSNPQSLAKRKRSAIFIPPVPAENTSNPTTEVSICKFKFTGGAKPSLQEKKMLSVDSGGNFRYYSGTGDKSMRGYEYFPRESLQQCQEISRGTPAGVFLAASAMGSGEKIPEDVAQNTFFNTNIPIPKIGKEKNQKNELKFDNYQNLRECLSKVECTSPDVMMLPDSEETSQYMSDEKEDLDLQSIYENVLKEDSSNMGKRSRKSRKSLARERLEQTFKEKGFLIQTQQLESAEGATYCKFRQLRKFTRYLFRSWKDYLPNNVRDLSIEGNVDSDVTSPKFVEECQDSNS